MSSTVMIGRILSKEMNGVLAIPLVERYAMVRRAFEMQEYEQTLSHAGKFAEIIFHWIQSLVTGSVHQKLGSINDLVKHAETLGPQYPTSIRVHIPRLMHVIYGFRSKQGGAHWAPGVVPTQNEFTVVWAIVRYSMIEISQFAAGNDYAKIAKLVEGLHIGESQLVEILDGKPHVNVPGLSAFKSIMLILEAIPSRKSSTHELHEYLPEFSRKNIRESIKRAAKKKYVKFDNENVIMSSLGVQHAHKVAKEIAS